MNNFTWLLGGKVYLYIRNYLTHFLKHMKHTGITPKNSSLEAIGLEGVASAQWNLPPSTVITECILNGEGKLVDTGALAVDTGEFTGRSPKDRFIVGDDKTTQELIGEI